MSVLRTIYETCCPRADVQAGTTKDEQFAADLAQVVNNTAPKEYSDPAVFFKHSYPTRGMRELLKAVLTRLAGRGGEIASQAWFKNGRFRVALGISARTLIGPARWSGFT